MSLQNTVPEKYLDNYVTQVDYQKLFLEYRDYVKWKIILEIEDTILNFTDWRQSELKT